MNTFLLHCYFEWNVHFTNAKNLRVLDCLRFGWLINTFLLSARRTPLVVLELNLNRLINFSQIVINAWSKFEIKIYFVPQTAQRRSSKNETILCLVWLLRQHGRITASGVRVFLLKFTNTELVHQLIRRLNSFNCFVVGRRFCSPFV